MPDSLQFVLRQSVEEVLEKMFFLRSFGNVAAETGISESELTALVTFDGEPSGSLKLRVTRGAARSISADFLGAEEGELTKLQVGEVICELANMICGSVLSRVESGAIFRLAPPQLVETGEAPGETELSPRQGAIHSAEIGGGNLTVVVRTESPVCSTAEKHAF